MKRASNYQSPRWSAAELAPIRANPLMKLEELVALVRAINPKRTTKAIRDQRLRLIGNRVDAKPQALIRGPYARRSTNIERVEACG